MPGLTGPIPKRSDERRRRNTTTDAGVPNEVQKVVVYHDDMEDTSLVKAPSAPTEDKKWHWLPQMQYEAAKRSAMREFYEPTDWAQLFLLCETLNSHLVDRKVYDSESGEFVMVPPEPITGATLSALMKGFAGLMFMEGDRRRLRIEIEREAGSAAARKQVEAPTGDNVIDIRAARLEGSA